MPALSALTAALPAFGFVGACYLVPASLRRTPRQHPPHVAARLRVLGVYSVVCVALTALYLTLLPHASPHHWTTLMGLCLPSLSSLGPPLAAVLLFSGPLATIALRVSSGVTTLASEVGELLLRNDPTPIRLRNLVLAPLYEELVYRSCVVAVLSAGGMSHASVVYTAPVYFGFAHVHHAFERLSGGASVAAAVVPAVVQFAYTYLFGLFATHSLLVTQDVLGPVVAHMFCNAMGLPSDWGFLTDPKDPCARFKSVILLAYVIGIGLFYWMVTRVLV